MRSIEPLLGTRGELSASSTELEVVAAAEISIVEEVRRLESVFSVFDKKSELSGLRRSGSTTSEELTIVLALADSWRERTGGAFDADIEALIAVWDAWQLRDVRPTNDDLAAAIVARDESRASHRSINLNAIAKGWIAGTALDHGVDSTPGVTAAWLSLGGDVVHRGDGAIVVAIENPAKPYDNAPPLARVELSNEALATSGGSRRWWTIEGERYPKVLDPNTGQPVDHVAGATVIASDGATADALATAAIVLPVEQTLALVDSVGAECLIVEPDGSTIASSERFSFET